jgi:hypothetical protein
MQQLQNPKFLVMIDIIDKIKMANLVKMGIIGTTIQGIITTKIMEISKEGI